MEGVHRKADPGSQIMTIHKKKKKPESHHIKIWSSISPGHDEMESNRIKQDWNWDAKSYKLLLKWQIYESGKMLEGLFIALPKKQGANESQFHRTVSLMIHMKK